MANNKDFIVKNAVEVGGPTKVTVGDAATGGSYTAGYDLSVAAYDSVSFSVASQETGVSAVFFKDDGTKMYIIGYTGDEINEYNLSTAWDISTASASSVLSVSSYETFPRGLVFKTDGTSLYFTGLGNDQVRQYDMTTAWDISTASYSKTFSVVAQETAPSGLFFKSDGTKMYVSGQSGVDINEYSLSTAWDVSTASYSQNFSISQVSSSSPQALFFKSDGTKVFAVGRDEAHVVSYTLSTAWDVSTASYDGISFSVSSQDSAPYGVFFKPDGTKMYIAGDTGDKIYQYTTGSTVTTGSFDLSTGNYFTDTPSADVEYTFSNAGDVQSFQLEVTGAVKGYQISGASYDSKSFSFASQDTAPKTIAFNNDGTKMYMQGQANDDIFQYSLSTAYDISTASYDSVSLDQTAQSNGMSGMTFKPDGTKLYTCDNVNDTVYQYSLSTAFDLSTASYDSVSFSVSTQATIPQAIIFNNDGTSMYICDNGNDSVFQYTLSTAYDISTASYASKSFSFASQDTVPQDIKFNANGTKLLMLGNANKYVFQYSLSTAYDVSTASYDSVFYDATAQATSTVYGLSFNGAGDKMYITTAVSDTVYQYTTGSAITVTWDADIAWPSGTAPDSPAAGEKDIYTFTTDDGGTTYIGVQSGDAFS